MQTKVVVKPTMEFMLGSELKWLPKLDERGHEDLAWFEGRRVGHWEEVIYIGVPQRLVNACEASKKVGVIARISVDPKPVGEQCFLFRKMELS